MGTVALCLAVRNTYMKLILAFMSFDLASRIMGTVKKEARLARRDAWPFTVGAANPVFYGILAMLISLSWQIRVSLCALGVWGRRADTSEG